MRSASSIDLAHDLTTAHRRIVGESWRWRMEQEHLAVSIFSQLAIELAQDGCEPTILHMVTSAASDEVRHALACRTIACRYLGAAFVPTHFRGTASLPAWPHLPHRHALALHIIEIACVSETLTAAFLTEMLACTVEPHVKANVRDLLHDELEHARLGWAYLRELQLRDDIDLASLAGYLPAILERQVDDVVSRPAGTSHTTTIADDPALEAHGYLGPRRAAAIYQRAVDHIVLPGLAEVGLSLRQAAELTG